MKLTDIIQHIEETKTIIKDVPNIIGQEAVDFYSESFQNEGFTDQSFKGWDDVKRRREPRKGREGRASSSRKILTGETGVLGDSLEYNILGDEVTIESHVPYAEAHNKGTDTAGRNRNITIPKRQFIGKSETLNNSLITRIKGLVTKPYKI